MARQFTLGKQERLKSQKAIEHLFRQGRNFVVAPFRIYFSINEVALNNNSGAQVGVGVSSKNFKRAVDRNRIKRLVREAYRLQKNPLREMVIAKGIGLHLFFVYTGKELPSYELVSAKVNVILSRLMKQLNENNTSNT